MDWSASMQADGPFTILGEVPNGAPGPDSGLALRVPVPAEKIPEVLRAALDVILSATGPRDGRSYSLNVHRFDQAIRAFMPPGHYQRAPDQAISAMDYKMYACRLVHRLLQQVTGRKISVGGAYNSHLATNARANALYEALLDVAAEYQVPNLMVAGWAARLEQARLRADQTAVAHRAADETRRRKREEVDGRIREEVAAAQQKLRKEFQREEAARRATEAGQIESRVQAEIARRLGETVKAPSQSESPTRAIQDWPDLLAEEGPRRVFLHLAEHGSVTEAEATAFLGSPRAYRRFSLDFDHLARKVPFRVRIEASPDGKRYVKEGER